MMVSEEWGRGFAMGLMVGVGGWVKMPDTPAKLRLCRAVPAPQWSQEPPDAEGWWWVWEPGNNLRRASINCVQVLDDSGLVILDRNGGRLYLTELPDRGFHWLPAVVPQPPTGEVGE